MKFTKVRTSEMRGTRSVHRCGLWTPGAVLEVNATPGLASIWKAWSVTSRTGVAGLSLETLPLPIR